MQALKYIFVFIVGMAAGVIIYSGIEDYYRPKIQKTMQGFAVASMGDSEARELERLKNAGASIDLINYQYDRMRRFNTYYHCQKGVSDRDCSSGMLMLEAKWYRLLKKAGFAEEAEIHAQRALEFAKKLSPNKDSKRWSSPEDIDKTYDYIESANLRKHKEDIPEWETINNALYFLDAVPAEYPKKPVDSK
jgi:hypothetical protein